MNKKAPTQKSLFVEPEAKTSLADGDNENWFGLYTVFSASDGHDGSVVDGNIEG